jgi:hypothetical protein
MKLRIPGATPKVEKPAHTRGIKQGNAKGAYESMPGHLGDGRSTAARRGRRSRVPGCGG